ncbi:MAG: rpe, Ribulose-phosphate 3-epimerase [Candidatus Saccharibacteria bacterium]|nr:rpe, Ribulose-phosphate 3-epimerase [Candidatus Saccharibacteria bacterium]
MSVIVPTVLAETPEDYKAMLEKIHTFARRVHIDLSDGNFAPSHTVDVSQIWWPQEWQIDVHAMVADPAQYVDGLIALKPNLIIFHSEVTIDLLPVLQKIKASGIKAGIALIRSTVPSDIAGLIEAADHAMIFSGELGKYGGTASLMQLEKVRLIKNINAGIEIGWDGGVSVENTFTLAQGGVDVMYVGSAIQKTPDPAAAYEALVKEVNKTGVM